MQIHYNKTAEIIDKYYLGEQDEQKLTEGAIKGYIKGLGYKRKNPPLVWRIENYDFFKIKRYSVVCIFRSFKFLLPRNAI